MRHAKRSKLVAADINHALRLRNVEILYGHSEENTSREYLTVEELIGRGAESDDDKGKESSESKAEKKARAKAVKAARKAASELPNETLYVPDDKVLDFNTIIHAPLPKAPRLPSFAAHFLAVEGVQPAVPANPAPLLLAELLAAEGLEPDVVGVDEDKLRSLGSGPIAAGGKGDPGLEKAAVKPFVRHVLSQELQAYYKMVTSALLRDEDPELSAAVLDSVRSDPGLQQLVPYFVHFISHTVATQLNNLPVLSSLMDLAQALLESEHMFVVNYLHQLLPPMLTCILGRRLCASPDQDHYALRLASARLVAYVVAQYGDAYASLQPRICKTLVRALFDTKKPLTTHFGALAGLMALGPRVVQFSVLPSLLTYLAWLQPQIEAEDPDHPNRTTEAKHLWTLFISAVKRVMETEGLVVKDGTVVPAPDHAISLASPSLASQTIADLTQTLPDLKVDLQACVNALGVDSEFWE